ncbi:25 kDa ookinete surface antigen precursor, putative [Plasmodium relictum]|uniref:25 kDa ookinete surface antigen, putative n=1 Tax=Plasmodium relictum TaxID=85471 RepID=A0A1J1H2T5_PLARL|nr:25 kDa ookinete surface antigen precursor, putative [Plasmodium relictum]CRG99172.1 25 kDa ookinete surface antigen precursor, putative [Plasmodium relictum]
MNMSYNLFFFFFILVIKYVNTSVTNDTTCKNGFLIQMSDHYECKCNSGFALTSEDTCEQIESCVEGSLNKPCGNFSKCAKEDGGSNAFKCACDSGYELKGSDCIPKECVDIDCENGKCILDPKQDNKIPICSCKIGNIPDPGYENKCTKKGETSCTLKCDKENEICKNVEGIYKCDCKDGFSLDKEKNVCSFSLFNILNLGIIFIISLIYIYII